VAAHPIVHVEIPVRDQEEASRFYGELFGWKIESYPEMEYVMFRPSDGPGGGLPKINGEMYRAGQVLVHVGTDDVDASLAKATDLGATVEVPTTEIPGVGWFAIFTDPSGNRVSLFKDAAA
jgi:predicted enzyme related to lactoylglutathione lyase